MTRIFSLSHNVFYSSHMKLKFLSHFFFSFAKFNVFSLDRPRILSFGKELMLDQNKPLFLLTLSQTRPGFYVSAAQVF